MNGLLLAEFASADTLRFVARTSRQAGLHPRDAFSPFPIEGLAETLGAPATALRAVMFGGGVTAAGLAYGLEWYSAVLAYPIDSGGRPLHSWPAFLLVPFAVGILAAAVSGFIAFMLQTGLPRLHHPLFEVGAVGRATSSAFLLALDLPPDSRALRHARKWLSDAGAIEIWQVTA